jgi:hypothetical protein
MPTPTYDLLASNVLTSATSSITFSSLPSTGYRDLVVVATGIATGNFIGMFARFNGDSGGNYNSVNMRGDGTTAASSVANSASSLYIANNYAYAGTNQAILAIMSIMDYTTSKHKPTFARSNSPLGVEAVAGRWANTSAINSVEIIATSGNGFQFASGSSFYLYGISA